MEKNLQLATECWFYAIVYGPLKKYYEYVSKRKSDTHTYLPSSESQSMSSPSSIVPRKSYRHTRASSRSLDLFTAEIDTTGAGAEVTTFEDLMIDPALLETKQRKQPKRRISHSKGHKLRRLLRWVTGHLGCQRGVILQR